MEFKDISTLIFIIIFCNISFYFGFAFFVGISELYKLMWVGLILGNMQVLFGFVVHFGFKNVYGVKSSDRFD